MIERMISELHLSRIAVNIGFRLGFKYNIARVLALYMSAAINKDFVQC